MKNDFKLRLKESEVYIDFLEAYGRDWFEFLPHHRFYNQACWYAFRQIVVMTIQGKLLTKGQAAAGFMRNGDSLLALAIKLELVREVRKPNIKEVYIEASDGLIVGWLSHIERTRDELRQMLAGRNL